jgi:hypothetical protein
MGGWDNDIHWRQARRSDSPGPESITHAAFEGRAGCDELTDLRGWVRFRPLLVVALLVVLGPLLVLFSPLPGLGLILTLGAMMAAPTVVLNVWLRA